MALSPNFDRAMSQLKALSVEFEEFPQACDSLVELGLPLFALEVDQITAETTNDIVCTYQVSDELLVRLATIRAENRKSVNFGSMKNEERLSSVAQPHNRLLCED